VNPEEHPCPDQRPQVPFVGNMVSNNQDGMSSLLKRCLDDLVQVRIAKFFCHCDNPLVGHIREKPGKLRCLLKRYGDIMFFRNLEDIPYPARFFPCCDPDFPDPDSPLNQGVTYTMKPGDQGGRLD